MIRTKHLTTAVAATSVLVAFPAGASAHHLVGHTVSAVQQDVKAAAQQAEQQVSSARSAIDNTGSHTRRHVAETVADQSQRAHESVRRTVASAGATVETARERVTARTAPVVAYGQDRAERARGAAVDGADRVRAYGERQVGRTAAAAQERTEQVRSAADREVDRSRAIVRRQYALVARRAEALRYRITRETDAVLAAGSVTLRVTGDEYSAGWTRSGGCWTLGVQTPLAPLSSRTKRRFGASAEPVEGGRISVGAAHGDATASAGC